MDTLSTRDNFLATHEGVVGVGEGGISWVKVGVEGTGGDGVVSQDVEICVIFFKDEPAEGFLVGCAGRYALAGPSIARRGQKE